MKATYGTGVFVLAHVGEEVPEPAGGLLPTVAWSIDGKVEYALDGGVFAAGAMLEWLCRELGLAEDPPALSRARERGGDVGRRAGAAGTGRRRSAVVAPQCARGPRRHLRRHDAANVARAALEGIAWRVADIVAAIRETSEAEVLRVDGGLTNEPLMLQLQADAIGTPGRGGRRRRDGAGAAALAGVGAGVSPRCGTSQICCPPTAGWSRQRDDEWRAREHERWRAFVEATKALDQARLGQETIRRMIERSAMTPSDRRAHR